MVNAKKKKKITNLCDRESGIPSAVSETPTPSGSSSRKSSRSKKSTGQQGKSSQLSIFVFLVRLVADWCQP